MKTKLLFILVIHFLQLMWVYINVNLDGLRAINLGATILVAILDVLREDLAQAVNVGNA